ncbi:MAG: ribose-5-phosphate isomerase RpiA [bacterium]
MMSDDDVAKKAAAQAAVLFVEDGMIVGLGTGSTAYYAIQLIGRKVLAGLNIQAVPTSQATAVLAEENHIPLLSEFTEVDVTIDGADEVDGEGNLIKGGGGALTREKIVAAASKKEVIIVDESKIVTKLGKFPLPVEVLSFGWASVSRQIQNLGSQVTLRKDGDEMFLSDNQNYILDCIFDDFGDLEKISTQINTIPGVVENGLFLSLADLVIVGKRDGSTQIIQFTR